ncbi:MAG: class I SAM-dependent methyltransferase [Candidatus Helarchaeota archaeon]|nr:class I SAM-dependent methyltransferase [Candidatus Helarchaeota archaeon]
MAVKEPEFDLLAMAQGLNWLIRQLYTQIAKNEKFPELLKDPKSFVRIVEDKKYKNLRITEAFLKYLAEQNVITLEDGKYQWNSTERRKVKGKTVVEAEAIGIQKVQEKAMPLFGILRKYAEVLPSILRGGNPDRESELIIWDSLYTTEFYNFLRAEAIRRGNLPKGGVIIDFGCRSGWSIINILEELEPRKIFAIDPSPQMIELAYENLLALDKTSKVEFIRYDFDFEKSLVINEKCDGAFIGLLFNRFTGEQITDMLLALRPTLKGGSRICGLQPIKDSDALHPAELLLFADKEFKGYPEYVEFKTAFLRAGFTKPVIENSMFFHTTYIAEKPVEKPKKKKKKR